jgi:hypothetical protein
VVGSRPADAASGVERGRRACAALLSALPAFAQSATGSITGQVFNPATGEYLRNAQVRIVESGDVAVSADEGLFRLSPVPAGRVTLEVTYTGYRKVTATVEVAANAPALIILRNILLSICISPWCCRLTFALCRSRCPGSGYDTPVGHWRSPICCNSGRR